MFQTSLDWLLILASASIRVMLILIVAVAAVRLFQLRDANVRHRVWSGVVIGMLSLPLLSGVLPSIPLPFRILPDPETVEQLLSSHGTVVPEEIDASAAHAELTAEFVTSRHDIPPSGAITTGELLPANDSPAMFDVQSFQASSAVPPTNLSGDKELATSVAVESESRRFLRSAMVATFLLWLAGAAILLIRIIAGLVMTARMVRQASRIEGRLSSRLMHYVSAAANARRLRICCHAQIAVPVTTGWWRPTILLPDTWQDWSDEKLESVLIHELTHVARRDFLIAILAELNRCVYWFHPAAWWLRRQLSDLAEAACDDAAISLTGNPTGYARHLLEVASTLASGRGRVIQPGLSMARESNVESRITMILDFSRPLSRRLTWKALTVLFLAAIPVIGLSAVLRPAENGNNGSSTNSEATVVDEALLTSDVADNAFRIHGRVVDEHGNGIGSAIVRLIRPNPRNRQWYAAAPTSQLIAEIPVDSDGHFDRTLLREVISADDRPGGPSTDGLLLEISSANFANALQRVESFETSAPLQFQLTADVAIRGRLLDLEGQPVGGATVSVREQLRCDTEALDRWLSRASTTPFSQADMLAMQQMTGPAEHDVYFPDKLRLGRPSDREATVTDENGSFELRGIGPDDLALLDIQRSGCAKTTLHVLGRQMEPVYARHASNISKAGAYYGRSFTYVMSPSAPVTGIVRDAATKQPIADVVVAVGGIYRTTFSHTGYIATTTDSEGRYLIEGLPIVPKGTKRNDGNQLVIYPAGLPYLANDWIPIPPGDGDLNPVQFDIELRRAVVAVGRVTDKATGLPVQAGLYYSPFTSNPHTGDHPEFSDEVTTMLGNWTHYHTDEYGHFRIPVIPGRGVIAAQCVDGRYCTAFGAEEIPEFSGKNSRDIIRDRPTSYHLLPSMFHSLKAIDVPVGASEYTVNLDVDSGFSIDLRIVDRDGQPISGVWVSGLDTNRNGRKVTDDHAVIAGLAEGKTRALYFEHSERKLSRFVRLVPKVGQSELIVTLQPAAVLTGRLLDPDGIPLVNVPLEARHNNDPETSGTVRGGPPTDQNGQFRIELPVGTQYTVIGYSNQYFGVVDGLDVLKSKRIDLGEMVVDPDAKAWTPAQPKREPIITDLDAEVAGDATSSMRPESGSPTAE